MPQEVTVSTYSDNDSIDGWAAVLHQLVDNPTALWTFNRVVVDDQDTPIAVSGGASIGHSENDTSSVATYSAAGAGGASVSWSVFGDDGGDFSISSAGVLTFKRPPDYENSADSDRDNVYRLMVHASNGRSTGMLLNVAVTVTDAVEKPLKPSAPSVSGTAASTTSLDVTWTAPDNTGRPAISGYDLQYRRGTSGGWTDGPQGVSGKRASFASLDAKSTYQVRVWASNADGDSPWSEVETRTKEAAGGDAPILVNAVVDRDLLTLTFNRDLDGASVPAGRTGFVRVVNRSTVPGEVRIEAKDDANRQRFYEPLSLTLNASEAAQFNSYDLELGNPSKGLAAGTGPGDGDWWLKLSSELDIQVMAYIRMPDGFVTAMHDIAPTAGPKTYVAFFNPASNTSQMSRLRLVNTGAADAATTITGVDDTGNSPGNTVHVVVPAESARELTASELESGTGEGIDSGALGDGRGKWRLRVEAGRGDYDYGSRRHGQFTRQHRACSCTGGVGAGADRVRAGIWDGGRH